MTTITVAEQGSQFTDRASQISLSWPWNGQREAVDLDGPQKGWPKRVQRALAEGALVVTDEIEANVGLRDLAAVRQPLTGDEAAEHKAKEPGVVQIRAITHSRLPKEDEMGIQQIEGARRPEERYARDEDADGVRERIAATEPGARIITAVGDDAPASAPAAAEEHKTKSELRAEASDLEIPGRSSMSSEELEEAIAAAKVDGDGDGDGDADESPSPAAVEAAGSSGEIGDMNAEVDQRSAAEKAGES